MSTVVDFLRATAEATPEAFVFSAGGPPGGADARTYGELAADAGRLARVLRDYGVGAGDRVGVALESGYPALVSLYGILDAGAVYVPLGTTATEERLAAIAADAELAAAIDGRGEGGAEAPVLRVGAIGRGLLEEVAPRLPWRTLERHEGGLGVRSPAPEDPAYIIYTSGSTGPPKGVVHDHRSAAAFAAWASASFVAGPLERVAAATALTFDISLLELLAPVVVGAEIVPVPRRLAAFPGAFAGAVEAAAPTVLQLVPQLWRGLLGAPAALATLRVGIVTGESMPGPDWRALREAAPRARLFNVYGSTELNDCACFELPADWGDAAEVPIGRPIAGARAALRVDDGPCPEGEVGELLMASPFTMRGYWKGRGDAGRFTTLDGERFFRTGDLARQDPDGALRLVGRANRSAKVGGEWVHLGEVEAVAARHPEVTEALAVFDETDGRRGVLLVAATSATVQPADLRGFCAANLPTPARPRRVELVSALPRNQHGKVKIAKLKGG